MKKFIEGFIARNTELKSLDERFMEAQSKDVELLPQCAEHLQQANYNLILGKRFGQLLQLSDNADIYEQYDLNDIKKLYECLLQLQPDNLEFYLEAARYEFSVMDHNVEAKQIVLRGLEKARQRSVELQSLLVEIGAEGNSI